MVITAGLRACCLDFHSRCVFQRLHGEMMLKGADVWVLC